MANKNRMIIYCQPAIQTETESSRRPFLSPEERAMLTEKRKEEEICFTQGMYLCGLVMFILIWVCKLCMLDGESVRTFSVFARYGPRNVPWLIAPLVCVTGYLVYSDIGDPDTAYGKCAAAALCAKAVAAGTVWGVLRFLTRSGHSVSHQEPKYLMLFFLFMTAVTETRLIQRRIMEKLKTDSWLIRAGIRLLLFCLMTVILLFAADWTSDWLIKQLPVQMVRLSAAML